MNSAALSRAGRSDLVPEDWRGPRHDVEAELRGERRVCLRLQGDGDGRTAPSEPSAASDKSSKGRTGGPYAWSVSTGMLRISSTPSANANNSPRLAAIRELSGRGREAEPYRLLGQEYQDRRGVLVARTVANFRPRPGHDAAIASAVRRPRSPGGSRFCEGEWQAIRHRKSFDISFRASCATGRSRTFIASARRSTSPGEEYIGVTTDETERVRANAAVHEAQAELARVARLTTMGELAASIAHEINQPLTAVVAYGNGALRWLTHTPPNVEEVTESLKGIVEEGTRAGEVIARIRELLKHRKPNTSRSTRMMRSGRSWR